MSTEKRIGQANQIEQSLSEKIWNNLSANLNIEQRKAVIEQECINHPDDINLKRSLKLRLYHWEKNNLINRLNSEQGFLSNLWQHNQESGRLSKQVMAGRLVKMDRQIRGEAIFTSKPEDYEKNVRSAEEIWAQAMLGMAESEPEKFDQMFTRRKEALELRKKEAFNSVKKVIINNEVNEWKEEQIQIRQENRKRENLRKLPKSPLLRLVAENEFKKPIRKEEERIKIKINGKEKRNNWRLGYLAAYGLIGIAMSHLLTGSGAGNVKAVDINNELNKKYVPREQTKRNFTATPTIDSTSTLIPSPTAVPTETPTPTEIPKGQWEMQFSDGTKIDLSKPIKIKFPSSWEGNFKGEFNDWVTNPYPVKTVSDLIIFNERQGYSSGLSTDESNINKNNKIRDNPNLAGIFISTYDGVKIIENRFLMDGHSGNIRVNQDSSQIMNLPLEILRLMGENANGGIVMVGDKWMKINTVKVIPNISNDNNVLDYGGLCPNDGTNVSCIPGKAGIPNLNLPGITLAGCYNYDNNKKEYLDRILVDLVEYNPIEPEVRKLAENNLVVKEAVEWGDYVNGFNFQDKKVMGEYLRESSLFKQLTAKAKEKMEPILNSIVGGIKKFGIECLGWAALRVGDNESPVYPASTKENPGQIVPEEVKNLAQSLGEVIWPDEIPGRVWVTGRKVNWENVRSGSLIINWQMGELQTDGKLTGHVWVAEYGYYDEKGQYHLIISQANAKGSEGMVTIKSIDSQEEFDQEFGTTRAVLENGETPILGQ